MKSQEIHEALTYLQKHGMTDDQLHKLHHKKSVETFSRALKYWSEDRDLKPKSEEYGKRLQYVMRRYLEGESNFAQLVEEAWQNA